MPPQRIPTAVFLTSFAPGGTERQMIELIRRLDRSRFDVHVACFHREGAWLARAEELASSITEFPISSFHAPSTLAQAAAFSRWCRVRRIEVLQACDLYTNIFALPAAAVARVPVRIGSRRGLNPDRSAAHRAAQRIAYRFADRVVTNSEAVLARLRREGIKAGRATVIANGIDVASFQPAHHTGPIRRVGTLARLQPVKGLDTLIEAARLALIQVPDLEFTIVGDGPLLSALQRQAADAGISERVAFAGHRDDVAEAMSAMDLFVLPSRSEAFPNAVMEAMAMALPIVATAVGGVPAMLDAGRAGLLVAPGRPIAMADAIVRLVRSPEHARELGCAARSRATARYSFDRMVSEFEALYLSVAAEKRTTPVGQEYMRPIAGRTTGRWRKRTRGHDLARKGAN